MALITGVSRANGIAAAVARRLAPSYDLMLTGLAAYDVERAAGGGMENVAELMTELRDLGARAEYVNADLSEALAPAGIVQGTVEGLGRVDALVATHAHSTATPLGSLEAEEIDTHLIVNVRATLLLVEAFARAYDSGLGHGRIVLFSSGQRLGPMSGELAYVASKGGLEALVLSLADALAEVGITVNAINPGPTDTGWLSDEDYEAVRSQFPSGRWGRPSDAARVVAWLTSDDGSWITGQILDSEGGFRRWRGS